MCGDLESIRDFNTSLAIDIDTATVTYRSGRWQDNVYKRQNDRWRSKSGTDTRALMHGQNGSHSGLRPNVCSCSAGDRTSQIKFRP